MFYSSFITAGDEKMAQTFADFASQGVTEFILDLRYNGGGVVNSALLLSSYLAPASELGSLFNHKYWNTGIQSELQELVKVDNSYEPMLRDYLLSVTNNLNLSTLYVITSDHTASASELVINGLSPYMNVVTIGSDTHGKFVASITLTDESGQHPWAIQPIVYRSANANGNTDFWTGLPAQVDADDDYFHELGDPNENLLHTALQMASGQIARKRSIVYPGQPANLPTKPGKIPGLIDTRIQLPATIQP